MSRRFRQGLIDVGALFAVITLAHVGQLWSAVLAGGISGAWALLCYWQGWSRATTGEQPAKRQPLTEEQIRREKPVCADFVSFRAGVRCAERIHEVSK